MLLWTLEFYFSADYSNGRPLCFYHTYPVVNFGVGPLDIIPCLGLSGISAPLPGSRLKDFDDDVELAVEDEISWALTLD